MAGKDTSRRPGNPSTAAAAGSTPASATTTARAGTAGRAIGRRRGLGAGKYNAKGEHVELHGKQVWIPSKVQAIRLRMLIELESEGVIGNLRAEVRVPLVVNNRKVCDYRCDHVYDVLGERGIQLRTVWEEVKGFITPEYKLKKKLFEAVTGETISEIMAPSSSSTKKLALFCEEWQKKLP